MRSPKTRDEPDLSAKLPSSCPSFTAIRRESLGHVDKTLAIYGLICDMVPKYFARPPGFGKSAVLSAVEELFTHGTTAGGNPHSAFKALAIDKLFAEKVYSYQVLHLNFTALCRQCGNAQEFETALDEIFESFSHQIGIPLPAALRSVRKLKHLLEMSPDLSLVFLIDGLDEPLLRFMDSEADLKLITLLLQTLLINIKTQGHKLRCALLTGALSFKEYPLALEGNTVLEVSDDVLYAELCGFTCEEVRRYFPAHLSRAAGILYPEVRDPARSSEQVLADMSAWYGGFCFDRRRQSQDMAPGSVLKFLTSADCRLRDFRSEGEDLSLSSRMLKSVFEDAGFCQQLLSDAAADRLFLNPARLKEGGLLKTLDKRVLLLRLGMLTIKDPYAGNDDELPESVRLGFPNREALEAFKLFL